MLYSFSLQKSAIFNNYSLVLSTAENLVIHHLGYLGCYSIRMQNSFLSQKML